MSSFVVGLTDHLEGPRDRASHAIFDEVSQLVMLADQLGVKFAWFTEHHAHAHYGHLPVPLLFALHLAGKTGQIQLGTAIICLNLHHPLDVAEQVAVADVLCGGRMAAGFGSGSTPGEFELFGLSETDEKERHARFAESLEAICTAWSGQNAGHGGPHFKIAPHVMLPTASNELAGRCWVAVNSVGSATIAGRFNFNMLFSHLRTPAQYREYASAYHAAGGTRLIAANRPVFVGPDDATAFKSAEPALRTLWRRFRDEGKIPAETAEPSSPADLCGHPINFIVGGPESVARQLLELHEQSPFEVANVEVRWAGLAHKQVLDSLTRLMRDVMPLLDL